MKEFSLVALFVIVVLMFSVGLAPAQTSSKPERPDLSKARIAIDFGDTALGQEPVREMQSSLSKMGEKNFIMGKDPCDRGTVVVCVRFIDWGDPQTYWQKVNIIVFIAKYSSDHPLMLAEGGCHAAPGDIQNALEQGLADLQLLDAHLLKKHRPHVACDVAWLPGAAQDVRNAFGL